MPNNFSNEYGVARDAIVKGNFGDDKELAGLVAKLKKLLDADGFNDAASDALETLREHVLHGRSFTANITGKSDSEATRTLALAAAGVPSATGASTPIARAAAFKLFRHSYFVAKKGARSLWVISTPKTYRNWPSEELKPHAANKTKLQDALSKTREYFGKSQQKDMHEGAQLALAWVQKALITLGSVGKDKGEAMTLLKRWFETSNTSATDLTDLQADLVAGFKKIQAALNGNRLVFTDYPPDRGTDDEKYTEAFVFSGAWKDALKVVYIEKGFFARGGNVLSGKDNWARIIVHELSHSEVGTDDYPKDNCYAWQGINPKDGKFVGNKARTNAENWAYFAADCACALSKGERAKALMQP